MKKGMIKVLTIGNSPSVKGGITSVISQIMGYNWTKESIDMSMISTYNEGNNLYKILFFSKALIKIIFVMIFDKPDIVHIHMSHGGSFFRKNIVHKICCFFKVRDVIHLHSSSFMDFYHNSNETNKKKIQKFFLEVGCVVALGREWKDRVLSIQPKANVVILKNTVSLPNMIVEQNVDKVSFLYLGVLVERKRVKDLLNAIYILNNDEIFNNYPANFYIGGTGYQESELKEYVTNHNIEKYVEFLGWIDNKKKKEILSKCQVLVMMSDNEGLPISILEGMSYGMPIISSNVGSVSEAVIDNVNGILYQAGDIDCLKNAIHFMLINPLERKTMGLKSREIIEMEFKDSNFFDQLVKIYFSLINE